MSTLITTNFSQEIASKFIDMFDVSSNSYLPIAKRNYMFAIVGKQTPWNAGTEVVPTPAQAIRDFVKVYDNGVIAKRMSVNDTSFVIPRIDWTSNTVYSRAGCTTCPSGTPFYVMNNKYQVFKCLDYNGGIASTDEPEIYLNSTSLEEPYLLTADGYKWKYLYTLSQTQQDKFLTADWMPVTYNKFVRQSAVNRSVDIVVLTNSGNNYVDGATQSIITVSGDGTGASLKANVENGQVQDIIVQNRGKDYTRANISFTDVTGGSGSNAAAYIILSPQNGHGYDPVQELYANTVMVNVEFDGSLSGKYPVNNEFRQVSIVKNPYVQGTSTIASSDVYTLYTKLTMSPGVGNYNDDEIVYQGNSLQEATFSAEVIDFDENANKLYLNNLNGTLDLNGTLKGLVSGTIRVVISKTSPELELYSGNILIVNNDTAVFRDADQTERIRFTLSF